MHTEMGEYLVGAYLKLKFGCDVVDYNVRPPGGGQNGLNELDVIGLNFKTNQAYICEVTTHIRGLLYTSNAITIQRIREKYSRQKLYANEHLPKFKHNKYMFWSPVVPVGYLTRELPQIQGLEVVINGDYKRCIEELRTLAQKITYDACNPAFRVLQVLEHLRD